VLKLTPKPANGQRLNPQPLGTTVVFDDARELNEWSGRGHAGDEPVARDMRA